MAFVIKEHRPWRWRVVALLVILVWAISGLIIYEYGWQQANKDYDQAIAVQEKLKEEVEDLTTTNRDMQINISMLSRSAQVDREAKEGIARSIKDLQDKVAELREEVSFYKGIISPEQGKSGLGIYRLTVMDEGERLYHYKLILTQAGKSDTLAEGEVKITFQGVMDNQERTLSLADIQVSAAGQLSYRFRYFQELGGSFRLPDGFSPRNVVVELLAKKGRKISRLARDFDWLEVTDRKT